MKNIFRVVAITAMFIFAMASVAFADDNDMAHFIVPVEKLADGGYSAYFQSMDTGDNLGISRIYLTKNGIRIKGCWVYDDAAGGLGKYYLVDTNGLLKGLIHDNYYDKWYLLDDHGRLVMDSGNYALETLTYNGDRSVGYPFTFGTYNMYLNIDPNSGAITNMTMGIAENNKLYYNTITRSGYNARTGQTEAVPCLYTSKMNEYSDDYLKQIALDNVTGRSTGTGDYWSSLVNLENETSVNNQLEQVKANDGYDESTGMWLYVDANGLVYGSPEKKSAEWLAANNCFAVTNKDTTHVSNSRNYYIQTGITRPDVPSYTKY